MRPVLAFLFVFFSASILKAQTSYFPPASGNWETIPPSELNWCQEPIDDLYSFLETEQTKSFIVLKDGKIVLE